jgi:hypothetical protein
MAAPGAANAAAPKALLSKRIDFGLLRSEIDLQVERTACPLGFGPMGNDR